LIKKNTLLLLKSFGPQGWWPTTPSSKTHPIYTPGKKHHSNSENQKLEICLGAILTQNTNWKNVVKAISALKRTHNLGIKPLLKIKQNQLEKIIKPSGYFRQKARRLKIFINEVRHETGGHLGKFLSGPTQKIREKLLLINGIGPETADSILLYAQGHSLFVVDAYTKRIGVRWGVLKGDETYSEVQSLFSAAYPKSSQVYGEVHALLVKLAVDFCRKSPDCPRCPLKIRCQKKGVLK